MTALALFLSVLAVSGPAPIDEEQRAPPRDAAPSDTAPSDDVARDTHPLQLASQLGSAFTVAVVWYSLSVDVNAADWAYGFDADSLRRKYLRLEGFRLDDNSHYLNSPGHPAAGALTFFLARANGYGRLPAFGVATAASFLWESVGEYRELVSINDMIFTPGGGIALGEASYATVTYLERKDRALAADDVMGRARLSAGPLVALDGDGVRPAWRIGFASDLVDVPGLLLPGRSSFSFDATERARLRADAAVGLTGLVDDDVEGMISIAGIVLQDVSVEEGGDPQGGAVIFALTSDFSHNERVDVDRLARVSLLGGDAEFYGTAHGAHVTAALTLTPDFATIAPRALDARPSLMKGVTTKSVLEKERYYYALGGTASASASASWGPLLADAAITGRAYESLDGLDRHQDRIDEELHGSERRFEARAGVGFRPSSWRVGVRVEGEHAWQGGTLGHFYGDGAVDVATLAVFLPL